MRKITFSDHNRVLADVMNHFEPVSKTTYADAVVVWNDVLSDFRKMVLQASLAGKPTLVMQHGLRASREYCPPYNKPLLADKIMVWGPRDRQRLLEAGVQEDRISVTGTTIFDHLIPRQPHEGINVVFVPLHWYEELGENTIVAQKLREIPGIQVTTKVVDGVVNKQFDNPISSNASAPDHLKICASVLSTADLVVSVAESTFEFLAYALDIPVLVVDVWKPKFHMDRLFIKDINADISNACLRTSLEELPQAIKSTLANPRLFAAERKKALREEAGFGLDALAARQRIINTINDTIEEWQGRSVEDQQTPIEKVTERISKEITEKEDAAQKTMGHLQLDLQEIRQAASSNREQTSDGLNYIPDYSIALKRPLRIEDSAWIEHVPFGMFLMGLLRPRHFVELGTYLGVSYCSFCQAAKSLGLEVRGYAVDTWEGDLHGGYYDQQVLQSLREHHDPLYGDFSRLLQSTFDDALKHFRDGSIDLLHIDGLHTLEAVKHDFETWLPKLSERAVVLFHDTNVRERDFGVWRFWEEMKLRYPHFEFLHGNGLGVLGVGEALPDAVKHFFEMPREQIVQVRNLFFTLGSGCHSMQLIKQLHGQLAQREAYSESMEKQLSDQKNHVEMLQAELAKLEAYSVSLENELSTHRQNADALQLQIQELHNQVEQKHKLAAEKSALEQDLHNLEAHTSEREQILQNLNSTLLEIYSSTAWKLIKAMWTLRLLLAPSGSQREKIGRALFSLATGRRKLNQHPKPEPVTSVNETLQVIDAQTNYQDLKQPWRGEQIKRFFQLMRKQYPDNGPISHVISLPLLSIGGSERVAVNFIRTIVETTSHTSVLLLVTDFNIVDHHFNLPGNVIVLNLSAFLDTTEIWKKQLLVYDLLKTIQPPLIHNINSSVMWQVILDKGPELRAFAKIYANIFSIQYTEDGVKAGYAEQYLRRALPQLNGLLSDNKRFFNDAIREYQIQDEVGKFKTIYTPAVVISNEDLLEVQNRLEIYADRVKASKRLRCIWAGRFDAEKKWELFIRLVERCSFCDFDVYGKAVVDSATEIPNFPNLHYCGSYSASRDAFLENHYDALIFTSVWEGLPNIIIEAGLYGVPVIAPAVGGIEEIVTEKTGYVLRPKATVEDYLGALKEIKAHPEEAAERSREMIRLIHDRHNWEYFLQEVKTLDGYLPVSRSNQG